MRSACACVCESWEGEQRPSENTFSLILILFLFYCKVPNNCYRWFQTRYDEGTLFANFSDFCPLPAEESLLSSQSWTVACPSNLSHFFFIIPICIWTVYFLRSSSLGFTQSKCGYQIATVELGYHCDRSFSHDFTAAILVYRTYQAVMLVLVPQNPCTTDFFSRVKAFSFVSRHLHCC